MAQELIDKIRAAAQANNLDPDTAVRIAQVESALNPTAQAKTSSAKGLFGVIDSTWKQYGGKPGQQKNPDENIRVGMNILADNTGRLRSALGREPSASELYAAHFFGPGTAPAVLSASPETPIADLLSQRAIKANPQLQGKTAGEVRQMLQTKMGETPAPAKPKAVPSDGKEGQPDFEAIGRGQMTAGLGSGYKAALALSFLGDEEDSDEKKLDEEEKQAAKQLAEYKSFNALEGLDLGPTVVPFATQQPQQVAQAPEQVPVQRLAAGGMPFVPTAMVRPSIRQQLTRAKADFDRYNAEVDAFNKAADAYNASGQEGEFYWSVPGETTTRAGREIPRRRTGEPVAPTMTTQQYEAQAKAAQADAARRNMALQAVADPERFNLSINRFFADGGEVDGVASQMLKQVVPMDIRTFGSTLFGSRDPITEKNFTADELAAMQKAVDTAAKRTGQTQKGSVQYVDYPRGEQIGPDFKPVGQTLGRFTYEKQPDGTTVVRDRYDFYNEGRKGNVEAYEKMGRGERALTVSGRALKNLFTGNLRGIPDELADAYIGREGRDVTIKLPPVKRADGSPEVGEEFLRGIPADLLRPQEAKREFSWDELRSRVREGILNTPRTPLGVGLELGYKGYKHLTGTQPLEDFLERARRANQGHNPMGKMEPIRRADGGSADPTPEELAAASRPATFNPNIARQGAAARRLATLRDVNTLPDPRTYAAVSGFLGTPPDQQGFSVMHPDIQGIKKAGEAGFYAGTATQVAPVAGKAAQLLGKLTGSALNERMLAGQSLTPGFNTPSPLMFAVKPRGGTVLYTQTGEGGPLPISKLDELMMDYRVTAARDQDASDDLVNFIKQKAPKYFTTTYGTADDPLRTAIRERAIEPFGRDVKKIPPYLVDAAKFPQARGHLQAKQELERLYDEMTGVDPLVLRPESGAPSLSQVQRSINQKMAQEGVPVEAQNAPSVTGFMQSEFDEYPYGTQRLKQLVAAEQQLPSGIQHALRTGEPMYDISPNFDLFDPRNVVDALKQIPPDKLKKMSFPEALIQGTQALAPVRDYRAAVEMAERGAKLPPAVLQKYTEPVAPAPGGQWVQITNPVGTELEGKLMKHSVGGYSTGDTYGTGYTGLPYGGKMAFDDGLVRVFSLRDKEGLPTITVEMAKPKGQEGWNVTQVRGRFNSEPQDRESVFNLFDKIDSTEGLGRIKTNSYTRSAAGEDLEQGSMVDWGREYDQWKQGISE